MAAERAVEERRLVDDVGARRHRLDRSRRRVTQRFATIGGRSVLVDLDDDPTVGPQVGEEARLVLEAAPADDVELGIVAHRSFDQPGEGRAFELGQVLTGEVGDEVSCRVDGPAVDAIHAGQPYQRGVTARLSRRRDSIRS